MAQTPTTPATPVATDAPTRLEAFLDQHARKVVVGLILLLGLVALLVALNLMAKQRETEAGRALVSAQTNEDLRAVTTNFPDTPAATSAMVLLAENATAAGDHKEAIATWKNVIALAPAEPLLSQTRLALGLLHVRNGETDEAAAEFDRVRKTGDATGLAPLAMMYHSELLEKQGKPDEARALLEQLTTDFPESTFAIQAAGIKSRVGFQLPVEVDPPPVEEPTPNIEEVIPRVDTQLRPAPAIPGFDLSLEEEEPENEEEDGTDESPDPSGE